MITVRLFAALREIADAAQVDVAGHDVGEVARMLGERYGERFASIVEVSSFVVNGERADRRTPIAEGDEVAILPPVSGGAPILRGCGDGSTATGGCADHRPLAYSPPCGSTASCWS